MTKSIRAFPVLAGALCAGAFSAAVAAADISPATAANMARNCFGCHGPDGRSPGAIPGISGKNAAYIIQSLKDFRSGARASTVMGRHAKGYSDAELEALSNYIGSLK